MIGPGGFSVATAEALVAALARRDELSALSPGGRLPRGTRGEIALDLGLCVGSVSTICTAIRSEVWSLAGVE